ncbi:MAG TPA: hypothetical protein GX707_04265 [Epulopiscium sp.]|nr:hypothetical protein [Candidatus Epulonipiscium sp.]
MKNIYIILSQTGTLFSKAIKWHTKDPYNHSSISFDHDLEAMYSFGRKRRYNPIDTGFIQENFDRGLFPYFPNARCCILEIPVTEAEYEIMSSAVEDFYSNKENYRYNLMGVISYTMGLGLTRKEHFFCSQFVSYILSNTSCWSSNPALTKPIDFLKIPNQKIVFEGSITEFRLLRSSEAGLKVS